MHPFPAQDATRLPRIVGDVCTLMHDDTDSAIARVERWLIHVLNHANGYRSWWFLQNMVTIPLLTGQDVIDLLGHVSTVSAVYCGRRLEYRALGEIAERRSLALLNGWPNGGIPHDYSLEAGRRMHLWPAPAEAVSITILYQRPMVVELVPDAWETLLLDGIIGMFGRHFDRDALTQDADQFEQRFYRGLNLYGREHDDVVISKRYDDAKWNCGTVAASSFTDSATSVVVPVSVSGVGYASIQNGVYPWSVA